MSELNKNYVEEVSSNEDRLSRSALYDVCGYIMRSRSYLYNGCEACKNFVIIQEENLQEYFRDDENARIRTRKNSFFVTVALYQKFLLLKISKSLCRH